MFQKLSCLFVALSLLATCAVAANTPEVLVSGRGIVRAAPDQVVIQLKMNTSDDDLIRVRKTNETQSRTLMDLATKNGVADSGFEVSRLDLSLSYNQQLRRQIYELQRDVSVRLNDLSKLDALLAGLLLERDVKIASIRFVHSEANQLALEARKVAVADAREKATQLAELSGYRLGKALQINITREQFRPFVTSVIPVVGSTKQFGGGGFGDDDPFGAGGFGGGGLDGGFGGGEIIDAPARIRNIVNQAGEGGDDKGEKAVSLGVIETSASVTITFALIE